MSELVVFLLSRLGEDEARSGAALGRLHARRASTVLADRALADVEAKRRIVERHSVIEVVGHEDHAGKDDIPFCAHCGTDIDEGGCPDLLDLASAYADHPDYKESWRP